MPAPLPLQHPSVVRPTQHGHKYLPCANAQRHWRDRALMGVLSVARYRPHTCYVSCASMSAAFRVALECASNTTEMDYSASAVCQHISFARYVVGASGARTRRLRALYGRCVAKSSRQLTRLAHFFRFADLACELDQRRLIAFVVLTNLSSLETHFVQRLVPPLGLALGPACDLAGFVLRAAVALLLDDDPAQPQVGPHEPEDDCESQQEQGGRADENNVRVH